MAYIDELELLWHDPNCWDYYNIHRYQSIDEYFRNPNWFIEETFIYAQKQYLAPQQDEGFNLIQPRITDVRAAHSVSTFLLGVMLAQKLSNGRLSNFTAGPTRTLELQEQFSFPYIWTLTCLFHDCGYYLENDDDLAHQIICQGYAQRIPPFGVDNGFYQSSMRKFCREYDIKSTLWQKRLRSMTPFHNRPMQIGDDPSCQDLVQSILKNYVQAPKYLRVQNDTLPVLFPARQREDIERYFEYRVYESDGKRACIDHGIAGGLLFFDRIIKNYAAAYLRESRNGREVDIRSFEHNNKHFSFNQLPIFAYISDCIMNHNIWKTEPDTDQGLLYQEFGLYRLLGRNYEKTNFYKNPLLFILAVADSIEPYKLFSTPRIDNAPYDEIQLKEIFRRTQLRVTAESIIIKAPPRCGNLLRAKAAEMEAWIDIRCQWQDDELYLNPMK